MTVILNGMELSRDMILAWEAAGQIEWPTDEEIDASMLEDVPTERAPVRSRDTHAAQHMTPMEIIRQSRRLWGVDVELQIEALVRLTQRCDALRWPHFTYYCGWG